MFDEFPRSTTRSAAITEHEPCPDARSAPTVTFPEPAPIGLTRHEAAVRRILQWADEAAAGSDYATALQWLATIEAIGDRLPPDYQVRQEAWEAATPGGAAS